MPIEALTAELSFVAKLLSGITVYFVVTWVAVIHVLLNKRNSRAAFGWVALIFVFPIIGALLYTLFGINRIQRKAQRISQEQGLPEDDWPDVEPKYEGSNMAEPGWQITGQKRSHGNAVTTYFNGEQAYPAMLESIDSAVHEVLLSTYIFDNDETGHLFVNAMARARDRGCRVCVLVDDAGIRYSFPSVKKLLAKKGMRFLPFMPFKLFPPSFSINLRTHRKILVCDRRVSFAGGMNIGNRQLVDGPSSHKAADLHFRFEGPLAGDLVRLFADDWKFAGGEDLDTADLQYSMDGNALCRLISDGPDENLDAMLLVILGVMNAARHRVWIMSPYFLPERQMMGCLQATALSGVDVKVFIPSKNNWPLVQWALQHNMIELLKSGVEIYSRPPPFAHSKCIIIDDYYALVGSSNLDPRSLRLNFELGIEVFDTDFNAGLAQHFEEVMPHCTPFTEDFIRNRSTVARLRDSTSSLFTPYL